MNLENLETRQATVGSKKLYTGVAPIQIVAVNPSRQWIAEAYNVDLEKVKEPNYILDSATRIDFWYRNYPGSNTEMLGKFAIFVSNDLRVSKNGRKQYIDQHSKTTWAENIDDLVERNGKLHENTRLDAKSARQAFKGEEDIYSLLRAYGNIDINKKPFMLEDFKAIVKGNTKELSDFFGFFNKKEGGVKVLFGVKDGQYQDVWTSLFLSVDAKVSDFVRTKITGEYGYKNYYGASLTFQEFVATEEPADDPFESSTASISMSANSDDDIF